MRLFVLISRHLDPQALAVCREEHIALELEFYRRRWMLASGPLVDGSGGVILMRAPDRETLDAEFFARDPFLRSGAAEYTVKEIAPAEPPRRSQEFHEFSQTGLIRLGVGPTDARDVTLRHSSSTPFRPGDSLLSRVVRRSYNVVHWHTLPW